MPKLEVGDNPPQNSQSQHQIMLGVRITMSLGVTVPLRPRCESSPCATSCRTLAFYQHPQPQGHLADGLSGEGLLPCSSGRGGMEKEARKPPSPPGSLTKQILRPCR